MPNFHFYLDKKMMVWHREKYYINASDQEEAIEIMKKIFNNQQDPEKYISPYFVDLDHVPEKEMKPEENNGSQQKS